MSQQLTLFDIPDRNSTCWSLNPWKIRLALNHKGIDYKTEWLEYPDIEPRLKPTGLEGDPSQVALFTCPTVQFPDGTYVMNSAKIIERIEVDYPEPSLQLNSEVLQQVYDLVKKTFDALRPVLLPLAPRDILSKRSAEYFLETRAKIYGMTLDELEKTQGGELAWANAKDSLQKAAALLNKTNGPFFLGDKCKIHHFWLPSDLSILLTRP
ncbi:glutathione S-transferase-like protein ustS [Colletotrichum liriopes]|uniref:Glutathione S-transferase-like protein ustS n=1 Tax=Colletotrichum liriopes TaxID=708192 RepID=A0AA37GYT1_9PEZI|nr:glutathione S-transferase-like protein ustS [Colletotrichum liriopes]